MEMNLFYSHTIDSRSATIDQNNKKNESLDEEQRTLAETSYWLFVVEQ